MLVVLVLLVLATQVDIALLRETMVVEQAPHRLAVEAALLVLVVVLVLAHQVVVMVLLIQFLVRLLHTLRVVMETMDHLLEHLLLQLQTGVMVVEVVFHK
jgi:hypothetical protein